MDWVHLSIIVAKSAIILLVVTLAYRFLGKRYAAQMNVYDLVTVVAIANALQNGMTEGSGELSFGLASATTLIGVGWLLSKLYVRAPRLQTAMIGVPTLLIYQGKILKDKMKREEVSKDELVAAMHVHGLTKPSEVGMAVLEVDGSISIVPAGRSCKMDTP